ncbi:MAG: right-handed parallel beta-helix repeat-containing protein, partial [Verrucomicrobiota bacterium]
DRFSYDTDPESRLHQEKHPVGMDRYCIYGDAALDAPGEWFFDRENRQLRIIPPEGKSANEMKIEIKTMPEALVVEKAAHVEISGFQFYGTTFRVDDLWSGLVENIDIKYGSTIANPFGPNLPHPAVKAERFSARQWFGETSLDALTEVYGQKTTIRNITSRFCEGPAITIGGEDNILENCLFEDIDWHGLDYGYGIDLLAAAPVTVRRVTLERCGGSEGLRLANHGPSLVEFCYLHHCGLRQSDGAIIQTSMAGTAGTEIRYNWIHDHNAFHWGGNGIRADDQARGMHIHHNVVWNCKEKGIVVKGDEHRVHHNTCFNNERIDILVPRNRLPGKPEELEKQNQNTVTHHNIGTVTGSWIWEEPKLAPYGETRDNLDSDPEFLRDPANHDFRLKVNSAAARFGALPNDGANWNAGYLSPKKRSAD